MDRSQKRGIKKLEKILLMTSLRSEWPTTTRRPIDPYILYGPHGYRTYSHARCQEVPTVDVNPSEVNSASSTHKVVIIIIRLHSNSSHAMLCFFFARFPEIGTSMNTSLVWMANHFHRMPHICARNHSWKYRLSKMENSIFHRYFLPKMYFHY